MDSKTDPQKLGRFLSDVSNIIESWKSSSKSSMLFELHDQISEVKGVTEETFQPLYDSMSNLWILTTHYKRGNLVKEYEDLQKIISSSLNMTDIDDSNLSESVKNLIPEKFQGTEQDVTLLMESLSEILKINNKITQSVLS